MEVAKDQARRNSPSLAASTLNFIDVGDAHDREMEGLDIGSETAAVAVKAAHLPKWRGGSERKGPGAGRVRHRCR